MRPLMEYIILIFASILDVFMRFLIIFLAVYLAIKAAMQ